MLDIENCCLVVVDLQEKLAGLMHEKDMLIKNTCILIKMAKSLDIPVVFCEQVPGALGNTVEEVSKLLDGIEPIEKSFFSCCGENDFNGKLQGLGRSEILLCGIETHICVYQTSVDLLSAGLNVTVVSDAVSSRTLQNKQIGLNRIQSAGGRISSVEMLLFELLKTAEHPKFRGLAKLIK